MFVARRSAMPFGAVEKLAIVLALVLATVSFYSAGASESTSVDGSRDHEANGSDFARNEIVSTRDDVVVVDTLADGEIERRIRFRGVTAKETAVSLNSDGEATGMKVLQVSEGKKFIQLIYDMTGKLVDCEYVHSAEMAKEFTDKFNAETETFVDKFHMNTGNVTVRHVRVLADLDSTVREIINYRRLRRQCKRLHKLVKKFSEQAAGRSQPSPLRHSGTGNLTNAEEEAARKRRDVLLLVRVPGTQWCGVGSRTENVKELGGFMSTDRCCRIHDRECPYYIHTLTEKYGLYNWRAYTLNHCDCDERFRTCLKMTNSAASNMVGKIFFNIVQTKCFILKAEKTCTKKSWWGKCLKEELEKKAHIRDSLSY